MSSMSKIEWTEQTWNKTRKRAFYNSYQNSKQPIKTYIRYVAK